MKPVEEKPGDSSFHRPSETMGANLSPFFWSMENIRVKGLQCRVASPGRFYRDPFHHIRNMPGFWIKCENILLILDDSFINLVI